MNANLRALGALGLGAVGMYLLDPDRGRSRRARIVDKTTRLRLQAEEAAGKTARDLANRTRGVMHNAMSTFRHEDISDEQLVDRVRSRLGRIVSHPRLVQVTCSAGVIGLSGEVLESEHDALVSAVESVSGVRDVRNELVAHPTADIPQLLGGRKRRGIRLDIAQRHWAPATRLLAGAAGTALATIGARAGGPAGVIAGLAGGTLLARSATNIEASRMLGIEALRRVVERKPSGSTGPPDPLAMSGSGASHDGAHNGQSGARRRRSARDEE